MCNIITPAYLRQYYLPGLDILDPTGAPMSDEVMQLHIDSALALFQRKYAVRLKQTVIKVGRYDLPGEVLPADESFAGIDYRPWANLDYQYHQMTLPVGPIKQIHSVGLWLPGMAQAAKWPDDWAWDVPAPATLRIYPGRSVTFAPTFMTGVFVALVNTARPVPHAWHVSYTAGYTDEQLKTTETDVLTAVSKLAAIKVLVPGSIDRNFAAGVTSRAATADGLSQSVQYVNSPNAIKFSNLIQQLEKDLEAWEKTFWARQKGVIFDVL